MDTFPIGVELSEAAMFDVKLAKSIICAIFMETCFAVTLVESFCLRYLVIVPSMIANAL